MKKFLCISLPVHQAPLVVRGQLENIARCCPNSVVILHVAMGALEFRAELIKIAKEFPFVELNPISYPTAWGGIMHVHLANYLFALNRGIDFEYFMIEASNSLFFRPLNFDYVRNHEMLISPVRLEYVKWSFLERMQKDSSIQGLCSDLNIKHLYYSIPEGCCFSKPLIDKMMGHIFSRYQYDLFAEAYPAEEVVFASVGLSLTQNFSNSLCLGHYHGLASEDLIQLVKQVRQRNDYPIPDTPWHGFSESNDINYPKYYYQYFYSVKPFPRDAKDPARQFVLDTMYD